MTVEAQLTRRADRRLALKTVSPGAAVGMVDAFGHDAMISPNLARVPIPAEWLGQTEPEQGSRQIAVAIQGQSPKKCATFPDQIQQDSAPAPFLMT
jgi:hypothetical protein